MIGFQLRTHNLRRYEYSEDQLTRVLHKKPPSVHYASKMEVFLLNEHGERKRKICGAPRRRMPAVIPDGIYNPYDVKSPRLAYPCTKASGHGTDHLGAGYCRTHETYANAVDNRSLGDNVMSKESVVKVKNFDQYVRLVKETMQPEELWDIQRLLVELEAMRRYLKDQVNEEGMKYETIDALLKIIKQSLDAQLVQVKRDKSLLEMHGIKQVLETFINGIVMVVERELLSHPEIAVSVLKAIEDEVLIPISETGYTELRRRQIANGVDSRLKMVEQPTAVGENG